MVALVDPLRGRAVRRFYVRAGQAATAQSIPVGAYRLRFAIGDGFSLASKRFCDVTGASEFDRTLDYEETEDSEGVRYLEESVTLHRVPNGNASSHAIDPALVFADQL